ncbi:uncharacterized protein G2W53_042423 [Senna tora]|uniref:Uncharacterized protein n=1 Tax=Senna tora TaxID=362788 RepID=A0A834SLT0_9FABA|nr:uncharacterized protein G2W53_042423 [Senna tora]
MLSPRPRPTSPSSSLTPLVNAEMELLASSQEMDSLKRCEYPKQLLQSGEPEVISVLHKGSHVPILLLQHLPDLLVHLPHTRTGLRNHCERVVGYALLQRGKHGEEGDFPRGAPRGVGSNGNRSLGGQRQGLPSALTNPGPEASSIPQSTDEEGPPPHHY